MLGSSGNCGGDEIRGGEIRGGEIRGGEIRGGARFPGEALGGDLVGTAFCFPLAFSDMPPAGDWGDRTRGRYSLAPR